MHPDKSAKLLVRIAGAARFLAGVFVYAYGQYTVFAAVLARVPVHEALAYGAIASVGISASVWYLLRLLDRFIEFRDGTRDAEAIAQRFDALRSAGTRTMTLAAATKVWVGDALKDDVAADAMATVKLRYLKFAIKQGLLPCETWSSGKPDEFPDMKQQCRTEAYASFIRNRGWRRLRDEPDWPDPVPRKPAAAAQTPHVRRKNWVTGWRW